jgi:hypothetical protein
MKSAIELAMERAAAALGDEKIDLTAEQRAAIDQIRKKCEAKWAEQEIAFGARLRDLAQEADPAKRAEARAQLQTELSRVREELFTERDGQIKATRRGAAG